MSKTDGKVGNYLEREMVKEALDSFLHIPIRCMYECDGRARGEILIAVCTMIGLIQRF